MIYTDGSHLTADSLDELYTYASKIGLNPDWIDFMGRMFHPHFDICGHVKSRVLADVNVTKVSCRELVKLCIKNFRLPETETGVRTDEATKVLTRLELPTEAEYKRMIDNIFQRAGIKRD